MGLFDKLRQKYIKKLAKMTTIYEQELEKERKENNGGTTTKEKVK